MHSRAIAAVAVIVSILGVAFVGFPHAEAAPPQPHNYFGTASDSTPSPLGPGTRITAWIDGVDYSNGTSVYTATPGPNGNYDMDVFGDNQTDPSTDNTPTIKTGGDFGDVVMFVAGDMTTYKALNPQQVFTANDLWGVPTTGQSELKPLTLAAAVSQPSLPKIGRITTQPADGLTQYLYLCNPTSAPIDASMYHLEKPVPLAFNGPTHALTGPIGPFGGILYVNLTSWSVGGTVLTNTGDGLKLVWNNLGGPAFQGSDIIVDRVEYNGTFSATFTEPVNTIMTDASAPGVGQEISRIGADRCQDTNSNSVDFGLRAETGRPAGVNNPPSVAISTPSGGEDWTGNTFHTIFWNQSDIEDASLTVAITLSINSGLLFNISVTGGVFLNAPPPSFPWNVNCFNAPNSAMIRVEVFDLGGSSAQSFSNIFSIDCSRPVLTNTVPPDLQPNVNVNTNVTLTFSEAMNQVATSGAISFSGGPPVFFTTIWGTPQVVTIDPTGPLVGSTTYTVTVSCAAKDVSDTGNLLANCPRTFSFTTGVAAFAPTVDLTAPDGGEKWTGGSPHNIVWTMSDADTVGSLTVTLEYNIGAAWLPVTPPMSRAQGANFFSWTVPCPTSTTVRVRATVSDGALSSQDTSLADFGIDCTAPGILFTSPQNNVVNVPVAAPIVIAFSEAMEQATVTATFTVGPAVSGIAFFWNLQDDILTVTHSDFATCTRYTATVAATAEDQSDPGNQMGAAFTWSFDSACAPAVNIVAPSPSGTDVFACASSQTLSFTVMDAGDPNVFVWINWTSPVQPPISQASRATGGQVNVSFTVPSNTTAARILVTAQDSTNLNGVDFVIFTIDCMPPSVLSSVPTDAATNVGVTASFVITFSEPMDPTTTQAAISVPPFAGALTFTWTSTSVVRVDHVQALLTSTSYTLTVSAVARDVPGLALDPSYAATFTTSATGAVTADAGGPYSGPAGSSVRLDGTNSTASLAIDNYTWEVSLQGTLVGTFYSANPLVPFTTVGTYEITLTVRDINGNFDADTATATISRASGGPNFFADYWWLFLILIIAVLLALFFLLGKRRKKDEQPMPPEVPPDQVEVTPPTRAPPARPLPPPPAGMPTTARGSPMTRDCPSCGTILDATDTECFMCGTKL